MAYERDRDQIPKDDRPEREPDALSLAPEDASALDDGEPSSEDSGVSSFLDRFFPPYGGRSR